MVPGTEIAYGGRHVTGTWSELPAGPLPPYPILLRHHNLSSYPILLPYPPTLSSYAIMCYPASPSCAILLTYPPTLSCYPILLPYPPTLPSYPIIYPPTPSWAQCAVLSKRMGLQREEAPPKHVPSLRCGRPTGPHTPKSNTRNRIPDANCAGNARMLLARCAVRGTHTAHAAILLCTRYAMSGTDLGYGGMQSLSVAAQEKAVRFVHGGTAQVLLLLPAPTTILTAAQSNEFSERTHCVGSRSILRRLVLTLCYAPTGPREVYDPMPGSSTRECTGAGEWGFIDAQRLQRSGANNVQSGEDTVELSIQVPTALRVGCSGLVCTELLMVLPDGSTTGPPRPADQLPRSSRAACSTVLVAKISGSRNVLGTDVGVLRCEIFGTDTKVYCGTKWVVLTYAYGRTRRSRMGSTPTESACSSTYLDCCAASVLVLTRPMLLPACYAMCGTDLGYGTTSILRNVRY
eukprot:3941583-Rhodomonas_salina.8